MTGRRLFVGKEVAWGDDSETKRRRLLFVRNVKNYSAKNVASRVGASSSTKIQILGLPLLTEIGFVT